MKVLIEDHSGDHVVEIKNERERIGYRIIDTGGWINPSPGVTCFLENTGSGARPWVGSVRADPDTGELNFNHVNRMPYEKSRIIRILKQ